MAQQNREGKLVKNTLILSIGTIFSSAFSFFVVPLYSRWLSAGDYGLYDLFVTYISLLMPVITLSCGEACFRFLLEKSDEYDQKKICGNSFAISVVGLIIGSVIIVLFFIAGKQEHVVPFLCLMIANTLFSQCGYLARGLRKPAAYTISHIIYLVFMFLCVTWFVYFKSMGIDGILYGSAVGYMAGILYVSLSCKLWNLLSGFRIDLFQIREIVKYSMPLIPNTISWWIVGVSDRTIVSMFLGPAFNGIYAIANKLPSLCTTCFGVFHMSWQENASDAINDQDRNLYFNKIFNSIIPMCISVCMVILAINRYMYRWIWDSKYIDGYYHVSILVTAIIFSFLAQFIGGVLVAMKKTKTNGSTTVMAAVVNLAVNFSLIRYIGLYAASVSTLISYIVLFFVRIYAIRKEYPIRLDRKSVAASILYLIPIVTQFAENEIIGVTTVLYAVVASVILNKEMLMTIIRKVIR